MFAVKPEVSAFFDEHSNTVSYLVADPDGHGAVVIDALLDFNAAAARLSTGSADKLLAAIAKRSLDVGWLLETHTHADHVSAGAYLKRKLGARTAIGAGIVEVQRTWREILNLGPEFKIDGSQFDRLLADGERLEHGGLTVEVMHTPGHTPACVTYRIGDAAFVGDTIFMPDYGTARCDFPGGDAARLYRSIRKILALPPETRLFTCHDYGAEGRPGFAWETTVAKQRAANIQVHDGIDEASFVAMRRKRDEGRAPPELLLPSIQMNIRAGEPPPPESNGVSYLRLPLNRL